MLAGRRAVIRAPLTHRSMSGVASLGRNLFFWDMGIRNALLNAFSADPLRPAIGALWEKWAIAEVGSSSSRLGSNQRHLPFEAVLSGVRFVSHRTLRVRNQGFQP